MACVRCARVCVRTCSLRGRGRGGCPTRASVVACARSGCWLRRCSAPRGRAERADDARALLLGGGREALISRGVRHFGNAYVVFCGPLYPTLWPPRHMMVRRATSARGGVLARFYVCWGGATGSGRRPGACCWGGCPLAQGVPAEPSPAGESILTVLGLVGGAHGGTGAARRSSSLAAVRH